MTAPLVLVVDDDAAIRLLLRRLIERHGLRVVEAGDARAARAGLGIDHPDAVILDLGLPDRDGLELVPELARQAAVIVVSARADSDEKVAALDLGAEDYVTKPFDGEELMARLRGALRRRARAATGETTIAFDDVLIDLERRRVTRGGEEIHLAPREYELLAVLARHPDKVITHRELLRAVWGPAHEEDVAYLRVAMRALRQRLERDPARPERLCNEPAVGYRLRVLRPTTSDER